MEIIGYSLAFIIGISLGLIGGGGSILTIPVLVYVLGIHPVLATAYSLLVVGSTSLIGAFNNFRKGLISIRTAVVFSIPSFIAVYLTRLYIVPAIPDTLFRFNNFTLTKEKGIMLLFALVMLVAALSMLKSKQANGIKPNGVVQLQFNYPLIFLEGLLVGVLTGIVGAGGGFLIIPALVLLARLPMKLAVGTSLLIIAIKSLIGFVGDIQVGQAIDWAFLLLFSGFSIIGVFVGGYLSNFIYDKRLEKGFGWFVLLMSIYIIVKELLLK